MVKSVIVQSTVGDSAIGLRQRLERERGPTGDVVHARPYLVEAKTRDKISDPLSKEIGNRNDELTIPGLAALMRCYAEITGDLRYREHPIELGKNEDCDRRLREVLGWVPSITLREVISREVLNDDRG